MLGGGGLPRNRYLSWRPGGRDQGPGPSLQAYKASGFFPAARKMPLVTPTVLASSTVADI